MPCRHLLTTRCMLGVAFGLLLVARPSDAQPPTFRSATQTVSLFATVTDASNRLVPDLSQDEFTVLDNGTPQPLTIFRQQSEPITVVVMLDTSGSMTGAIDLLKAAAAEFVARLLPDDRAAVGAFNDKVELSAQFSSDRDGLAAEVKDLDFGNGTRLHDALAEALDMLRGQQGRRVVLVFTDGDDTSSRIGRGTVLERAKSDEVMVYAIGLQSEYFDGSRRVRTKPDGSLRKLADETGGGYFELKDTEALGPTFTRVAQELHSQYVLGFEPQQADGKVHTLSVKASRPGLTVRARKSYVAAR